MLIITPNPAIDHTIRLTELRPGEVIRTGPGVSVAGGKGGNVARAARLLGAAPTVLAMVPAIGGDHLQSLYAAEDFALIPIPVGGRVRTCTAMVEAEGRVTLLNEPGAAVGDAAWDRLMRVLRSRLADDATRPAIVSCSGSLPPGAPADGYAQIVRAAHDVDVEVVVDAAAAPLTEAITAGADLVCPNVSEAEESIRRAVRDAGTTSSPAERVHDDGADVPDRAMAAAARLRDLGAQWAVVTAGAAGAAIAGPGHHRWLAAPTVTVRNPIGAGDSFVAGVLTARIAGAAVPAAIRRGLASGSASVETEAAGVLDPERVAELERALES